uniref:Secreted protein n=1 Tax=Romanomermis culicivorax TaxID=13658 RepID=A0A915KQE0_ROMCU
MHSFPLATIFVVAVCTRKEEPWPVLSTALLRVSWASRLVSLAHETRDDSCKQKLLMESSTGFYYWGRGDEVHDSCKERLPMESGGGFYYSGRRQKTKLELFNE